MSSDDSGCPVCRRHDATQTRIRSAVPHGPDVALKNRTHSADAVLIDCPVCGRFVVTEEDDDNLKSRRSEWEQHRLSALLREQSIRAQSTRPLPPFWLRFGMDPYGPLEDDNLTPIDLEELLSRWPSTVPDRINRTLCNLAWLSRHAGKTVEIDCACASIAFAATAEEARFHIKSLEERGFLKVVVESRAGPLIVELTAGGWERFEELTHGSSSPENPVFVAMWFEEEMKAVYEHGIKPAVQSAGYRVTRVDQKHFNDFIMDQVFGDIRAAPFVVADFTGHRNGVYLEAGFARGLGLPVIHTCAERDAKKAHFDIQQLNQIRWKNAADLNKRLCARIRGTIGLGPYASPASAPAPPQAPDPTA